MVVDAFLIDGPDLKPRDPLIFGQKTGSIPDNIFHEDRVIECLHGHVTLVRTFKQRVNRG